jgi:Ca2+-binding RTX toxin-like protein
MAILANDGRMALEGVSQYSYSVNQTNLSNSVAVTGVQDSIYSTWAGIYGSQLNLPYNNIQSNSYLNLYTRHMGGWATVDLGTGAGDVYDTVALQRTGDWVLNFQGGDKLVAGSAVAVTPQNNAYIYVNAYITSNASFNTDGSLKLVAGRSGTQNVSFESGLTGNQAWQHRTNGDTPGAWGSSPGFDGAADDQWNVTGAAITNGIYTTTQHDNNEQSGSNTGAGLTLNAAGDVNGSSTVTLGDGTDNLLLLNNTRTVTDYWWQSFWIFGGRWNAYTYVENAWTVYRDGTNWKAYNNYKDYTVTISSDVETVYYSFVNDNGSIDYQVFKNDGTIDHYSNGFPPLEGSGGSAPTPNNNPINPLSLGDSGFVPSTNTADSGNNTANIQVVAPKGATVSFYTSSGDHNEADDTSGLRTFTSFGAQQLSFTARDNSGANADPAAAELGTIRIRMGSSTFGDSQYKLFLGTNGGNDTLAAQSTRVLAYGFNGNDTLNGSPDRDTLIGGAGNDILNGGDGRDSLFGGSGNDAINGNNDSDYIEGGDGNDVIVGSGDSITVTVGGGSIVDTLLGGAGNDTITGGVGDFVQGGANDDRLIAADTGTTYLVDNEGINTIITNAYFDAVYFSASNKGNYTNTVVNGAAEVVTMLLEHGSTTRSVSDTNFTSTDTPTSAYVYVPDAQNSYVNATSAGTADVINFYGGDRYDTGYWDKTVNTFLFGTWYQWRNYYTIDGLDQYGNSFGSLDTPALVLDWASDGEMYYGSPSGILAPLDPDTWRFEISSAYAGIAVSQAGYKGYFTFFNSRVNTSTIFYVDAGTDNFVTAGEMTYLGVMNGQAGSSVKYGSFVNGQFSLGNDQQQTQPLGIVDSIDLAAADDTIVVNVSTDSDNLTSQTSGLTLTANVQSGVTPTNVTVYDWNDVSSDGLITSDELTTLTVTAASVSGTTFQGDISLAAGVHNIVMTQTVSGQTSDLDPGTALTITVKTDFTPPQFTAVTASASSGTTGALSVTVDENASIQLYAGNTAMGSAVAATANNAATINVAQQQSALWSGVIRAVDTANNSAIYSATVWLDTASDSTINGASGTNIIYGFGGADSLTSSNGNDSIFGGDGNDTINSGTGIDAIDAGDGNDIVKFDVNAIDLALTNTDTVNGGNGNDTLQILLDGSHDPAINDQDFANVTNFESIKVTGNAGTSGVTFEVTTSPLVSPSASYLENSGIRTFDFSGVTGTGQLVSLDLGGRQIGTDNYLDQASTIIGSSTQSNSLIGGSGDDSITGGIGNDTITGGAGIDTFIVGSGTDTITDLGQGGADVLVISAGATANATVTTAWTASSSTVNTGTNTYANAVITTSGLAVNLNAAAVTSSGSDAQGYTVINNSTATTITGSEAADSITGGANDDTLLGGAGNDTITGGAGADVIDSGSGTNTIVVNGTSDISIGESYTGGGTDTLSVTADTDFTGVSTLTSIETFTLADGVDTTFDAAALTGDTITINGTGNNGGETLTLNGTGIAEAIDLSGLTLDTNDITGVTINALGGNDTITGSNGADTITGGNGNDTYVFSSTASTDTTGNTALMDVIVGADLNERFDLHSFPNYDAGSFSIDLDLSSVGGNDYIVSWTSNNGLVTNYVYLQDSTQTGGFGFTDNNGVIVLNTPPVASQLTQSVVTNFAQGTGQIAIYMDELVTGLNLARHRPLYFSNQSTFNTDGVVTVNINTAAVDKGAYIIPYLPGDAALTQGGTTYNMATADNVDYFLDHFYFDAGVSGQYAGIVVTTDGTHTYVWADIHLGNSRETSFGTNTYLLATLTGDVTAGLATSDFTIFSGTTSSGIANFITGTSGNDNIATTYGTRTSSNNETIVGGTGDDTITGGAGVDTFIVDSGTDTISDLGQGGADVLVISTGATANATVTTAWTASSGTVNTGTNTYANAVITTSGLAVNLNAAAVTSSGSDAQGYTVINNSTATTITGSEAADSITGGANDDTLLGGAGNDTITGGAGGDSLTGGAGADTFAFGTNGSGTSAGAIDVITDFNVGSDILTFGGDTTVLAADSTVLSATNVNTSAGGLVTFDAGATTTLQLKIAAIQDDTQLDAAGSIAYFVDGTNGYVYYAGAATGNTDDQIIQLTGVTNLTIITGGSTTTIV